MQASDGKIDSILVFWNYKRYLCIINISYFDIFQFVEGWVNTETLVGSLQTEAGNKSKDEIKSFLADFGVEDDIGTISTILAKFRGMKSSGIPKYPVLLW